jgi:hypothetical protein
VATLKDVESSTTSKGRIQLWQGIEIAGDDRGSRGSRPVLSRESRLAAESAPLMKSSLHADRGAGGDRRLRLIGVACVTRSDVDKDIGVEKTTGL